MAETAGVVREISDLLETHYAVPVHVVRWRVYCKEICGTLPNTHALTANDVNIGLRKLGLSHTLRFTPEEIDYYHLLDAYRAIPTFRHLSEPFLRGGVSYTGIGITTQKDRFDRYFVAGVLPGSPAAAAGLLSGDELIAVEGQPFKPVLSFEGLGGRPVLLQLRREHGGRTFEKRVTPKQCRPARMLAQANRHSSKVVFSEGRYIRYIKAWTLAGQTPWRSLTNAISQDLGDCAALVLDLRGGIGGASPDFADYFVGRSPELRLKTPRCEGETVVNPRWRKPVVLIADGTTKSGSEVLVFAMRSAGVPVVGERTAGEVVAGKPFLLSDKSLLLIAAKLVTVDGITLEGKGVDPTVNVAHEIPYSGGEDRPLKEALRIACSLTTGGLLG